jgi:hypothetical protein
MPQTNRLERGALFDKGEDLRQTHPVLSNFK